LLRWRLGLGGLLIAALAGVLWLDVHCVPPAAWLFGLVVLVALAGAQEVISLLAAAGLRPLAPVIYGGTLLVLASNAVPLFWSNVTDQSPLERLGWPLLAFTLSMLAALVGEMWRYRKPGGVMVNVALATFGIAYVGLLLSFSLQLRVLSGPNEGIVALAALVIVVKMGDTGAYTTGRLVGRHKMAPSISPGKTIEGGAGALAFACLGAWFSFHVLPQWINGTPLQQHPQSWLLFGMVVGGAGLIGDLAESMFKRDVGSKDSSNWLPGFGGVLDLLDSILFAAPFAYACWLLGHVWQ
jgi:phosphatidate cytidylyltransferase